MFKKLFVCLTVMILPTMVYGQDLEGVKCLVNPKADAKADASAEHMEGTVYFCCNNCKSKFEEKPEDFLAMANHQLVATGQYEQKACPFSGAAIADGQSTKIGETEVGYCCGNCKKKVEEAGDMVAQVKMVFAKDTFEKGFQQAESDDVDLTDVMCPMMGEAVSADYAVEHHGGKVFFCCESCVEEFNDNKEEYTVVANAQLVATGQYQQTACPFSGGKLADGTNVKVGDHEFGFCCKNCKAKVEGAEDDDARMEMIFTAKAFEKGFAKAEKK